MIRVGNELRPSGTTDKPDHPLICTSSHFFDDGIQVLALVFRGVVLDLHDSFGVVQKITGEDLSAVTFHLLEGIKLQVYALDMLEVNAIQLQSQV